MSRNPLNLAVRLVLEVAGLVVMGRWGWSLLPGGWGIIPGLGIPLVAAAAWGIFRVPNDGGPPVVEVPGRGRLSLEMVYFGTAVWMAWHTGDGRWGLPLALATAVHYGVSWDRVWLLARNRPLPRPQPSPPHPSAPGA